MKKQSSDTKRTEMDDHLFKIITSIGVILTLLLGCLNFYLTYTSEYVKHRVSVTKIQFTKEQADNKTFASMLNLLASPRQEVRVGGIYALENLARSNRRFYWPVVHALTVYVKTHYNIQKKILSDTQEDLQAILSFFVEGQYDLPHVSTDKIDLSYLVLKNVDLSEARFIRANFEGSYLNHVNFYRANLYGANFSKASLTDIIFVGANLQHSNFTYAILSHLQLIGANLEYSKFGGSVFKSDEKDYINNTFWYRANLANADFCLGFDYKKGDILQKCASGLTCDSFENAQLFNTTILPDELKNCGFKVKSDLDEPEIQKEIKSGNLKHRTNSYQEELVYKYKSPY